MINLGSFEIGGGYKEGGLKSYCGEYQERKKIAPYDLIAEGKHCGKGWYGSP